MGISNLDRMTEPVLNDIIMVSINGFSHRKACTVQEFLDKNGYIKKSDLLQWLTENRTTIEDQAGNIFEALEYDEIIKYLK